MTPDSFSPMIKHYLDLKDEYADSVLLYRLGDFYEMFFEDAEVVSKELELTLTSRSCGKNQKAPMCGVPYANVDNYISRLIAKGYKVAVCDQLEDASQAKGLVARGITRVVTPGTLLEGPLLDESTNNFLCSLFFDKNELGLIFCDISTGELLATTLPFDAQYEKTLKRELIKFNPKEIILNRGSTFLPYIEKIYNNNPNCTLTPLDEEAFKYNLCIDRIKSQFGESYFEETNLEKKGAILPALGALFYYINTTQRQNLKQISSIDFYTESQFMNIDLGTRRNLELVETLTTKEKKGSLLWVLDQAKTAMGKRLIRSWIERPLVTCSEILNRQDAVAELFSDSVLCDELSRFLNGVYDLERMISRISYGGVNPRDMKALALTLSNIPFIKRNLRNAQSLLLKKIHVTIDPLDDLTFIINEAIIDEPPTTLKDGGVINSGYSIELDALKKDLENSSHILSELEKTEKEKTGISKLKIGYNRVFGYYIEVSNSFKNKVPERYIRKQTLTGGERFITEELREIEMRLLGAKEKVLQLEIALYDQLREVVLKNISRIKSTAHMIASLDALLSLAEVARQNNYCKPEITCDKSLIIKDGRHPVAEKLMQKGEPFVSNDSEFTEDTNSIYLITGPNMAGKSTYMRQVAIITLMAQIGSFIPASYGKIGVVDSIFTRVGASDDLVTGQSTFMVEMNEVSNILKNATEKSLVVFDEIGRGTSTFDGMSIARSVIEYVSSNIHCKTLFATHYHELIVLEGIVDGVKNYSFAVKRRGDDITFLRRIVRGGTDDSYGIEVAKLAGVPEKVLKRAHEILTEIENNPHTHISKDNTCTPAFKKVNMNKKDTMNKIIEDLKLIDTDTLTPIESLGILSKLSKLANEVNICG